MKRLYVLLMILVLVSGSIFAKGQDDGSEKTGLVFGATYMTMNNPFFIALNDGIKEIELPL